MNKNIFYALFFVLCASTGMGAMEQYEKMEKYAWVPVSVLFHIAEQNAIERGTLEKAHGFSVEKKLKKKIDAKRYERRSNKALDKTLEKKWMKKWRAEQRGRDVRPLSISASCSGSESGSGSDGTDAVPYRPKRF